MKTYFEPRKGRGILIRPQVSDFGPTGDSQRKEKNGMDRELKKILRAYQEVLAEGGPSPEHERLKTALDRWAEENGFPKSYKRFTSGEEPDVLRATPDDKYLFVGDAKHADNEDPDNSQTLERIERYIKKFASLLGKPYDGGRIAIATNSESAAVEWVKALNFMCKRAGISANGNPPDFQVTKVDGSTWVIQW